jgi:hypothetical protein
MKNPEVALVFHHAKIGNQREVQLSSQCTKCDNYTVCICIMEHCIVNIKQKRLMTL